MNLSSPLLRRPLAALAAAGLVFGALSPDANAQRRRSSRPVVERTQVQGRVDLGDVGVSYRNGQVNVRFGRRSTARRSGTTRGVIRPRCEPAPRRTWVPGYWDHESTQVWVEGRSRRVWIEAVYETRYDSCGRPYEVMVCAGRWETVCDPGYYETRRVRVWRPGTWRVIRG